MMTQLQGISTTGFSSVSSFTAFQAEYNEYVSFLSGVFYPTPGSSAVFGSTVRILQFSFWLKEQKAILSREDFNKLLTDLNWKGEEKKYLKIASCFDGIDPYKLEQVEPRTIFLLALNSKKYQPVIAQIRARAIVTQDFVRSQIKLHRKPRVAKQNQKPSIWRPTIEGGTRYAQIPPIHEEDQLTGKRIQKFVDTYGLSIQAVIRKGMEVLEVCEENGLSFFALEQQAPSQFLEILSPIAVTVISTPVTQAATNSYEVVESPVFFEPVYFEYSDSAEDNNCSVIVEENVTVQEGASIKLEVEKHPVDLLVEILQTANYWREISEVSKTYEEYKQQAWDLLTPLEQRRVISITPLEVQKLSHAKRTGLIVDFSELREGVYQVQCQGSSFLEIVNQQRVDYFLARL